MTSLYDDGRWERVGQSNLERLTLRLIPGALFVYIQTGRRYRFLCEVADRPSGQHKLVYEGVDDGDLGRYCCSPYDFSVKFAEIPIPEKPAPKLASSKY